MENNTKYFANKACAYFPCHKGMGDTDAFNCLFCFCPLYRFSDCPGRPEWIRGRNGEWIKDCSGCTYPHKPEHYDEVLAALQRYK